MEEYPEGFVVHTVEEIRATSPFPDEDAYVATVTKDIDVTQLADEITKASGTAVTVAVVHGDPEGTLYVRPLVDPEVIEAVVEAHVIDPDYGLPADVRERQVLLEKIDQGISLSSEEVLRALKLSLSRP
jgi:hypothetical protein